MTRASALWSTILEMGSKKLCVSLTPGILEDVFASDVGGVDCVEVRLDYLKIQDNPKTPGGIVSPFPLSPLQGEGTRRLFNGTIEDELEILEAAVRNGARYVDIDYRYARPLPPADVIASYHNFEETPPDLVEVADRALASKGQIAKVATQVNSWPITGDCWTFWLDQAVNR
jgi:3-dehydroquinate dehydratase